MCLLNLIKFSGGPMRSLKSWEQKLRSVIPLINVFFTVVYRGSISAPVCKVKVRLRLQCGAAGAGRELGRVSIHSINIWLIVLDAAPLHCVTLHICMVSCRARGFQFEGDGCFWFSACMSSLLIPLFLTCTLAVWGGGSSILWFPATDWWVSEWTRNELTALRGF